MNRAPLQDDESADSAGGIDQLIQDYLEKANFAKRLEAASCDRQPAKLLGVEWKVAGVFFSEQDGWHMTVYHPPLCLLEHGEDVVLRLLQRFDHQ
jgi:hypothetical protein